MTKKAQDRKVAVVTGAAGFLGGQVAISAAAAGYRVIAVGHGVGQNSQPCIIEAHEGDVSLETLSACSVVPDVIFHCAGGASVAYSFQQPQSDFRRTVESTAAVLEYARQMEGRTAIVIPSSAAVYGRASVRPLTVQAGLNPVSPYGIHKKIAEDLTKSYAEHFALRVAIVRLFSVYGPGLRKQLLWDACTRLTAGGAVFGGSGNETRDWLHIEDAASLMLRAATQASEKCPIANGGTAVAVPIRSVIHELSSELGGGTTATFSGISRLGDPTDYVADIAESIAWGWRPAHPWVPGVRAYARWFKEITVCPA